MNLDKKFNINYHVLDDEPIFPVSYLVRDYLEDFIIQNVLQKYNIILSSKWIVNLIYEFTTYDNEVDLTKPKTYNKECVKSFHVGIGYHRIYEGESNLVKNFVHLIFEGLVVYFQENYRKVPPKYLKELLNKIDWEYLYSINFPATDSELKLY